MIPLRLRHRARSVLAAFLAAVCVTVLAPFVRSSGDALLCSADGRQVVVDAQGRIVDRGHAGSTADDHAAHCPLCMPVGAPPTAMLWIPPTAQPLAPVRTSIPTARLASPVGAPLPARGPPRA